MWEYGKKHELYHWGIKGQKWGIRRYQNEDGSLTPEGRERYGNLESKEDIDAAIKADKKFIKAESEMANTYRYEDWRNERRLKRVNEKFSEKPDSERLAKKAQKMATRKQEFDKKYDYLLARLNTMTPEELNSQAKSARKKIVGDAALSVVLTAGLNAIPGWYGFFYTQPKKTGWNYDGEKGETAYTDYKLRESGVRYY